MNHIVNRESEGMKRFASQTYGTAEEMETVCSRLRQLLHEANSYMQDKSGQEAISIVEALVEESVTGVRVMRMLADRIQKSACLLEESDRLL